MTRRKGTEFPPRLIDATFIEKRSDQVLAIAGLTGIRLDGPRVMTGGLPIGPSLISQVSQSGEGLGVGGIQDEGPLKVRLGLGRFPPVNADDPTVGKDPRIVGIYLHGAFKGLQR